MNWFWVLVVPLVLVGPVHSRGSMSCEEDKRLLSNDTMRPLIYYCRSRNMEDFSCYWRPLESEREGVRYVLSYSKENGPVLQCPDYVSSGPHSCHFNSSHTNIWKMYCMIVVAVTPVGNYTSPKCCLDVGDIVETDAPVSLTHELHPSGGYEIGQTCLVSWKYPHPSDLQFGWITLVYELRYRRADEQDNWKEKTALYEPQLKLLGLPAGDFVVQVRCRSHNNGRWSQWSLPMYMSLPARPPTGKLLLLLLLGTGVSVVVLVGFSVGLVQQSKRIKEYFLPPIPKPRILGIDPLLLKKGNLEEINRHFSTFHGYSPPSYSFADDVWDQVSADDTFPLSGPAPAPEHLRTINEKPHKPGNNPDPHEKEKEALIIPCNVANANANPRSYVSGPFASPASDFVLPVPGSEYSVMGQAGVPESPQNSETKKGNLEEMNGHFSTFHGYSPPSYSFADDVWDQVSADDTFPRSGPAPAPEHLRTINEKPHKPGNNPDPHEKEKEALIIPCNVANANANQRSYVSGPFASPASDFVLPVPGSEYSVMGQAGVPESPQNSEAKAFPDFYTCVQLLQDSGEVHLVPRLAPAYCGAFPTWDEKNKQKDEFEGRKNQDGGQGQKQEVKQEVTQEVRPVSVVD